MYDVYIGNDSASLGSERTDIMNTKGKKPKRKVKMDYGDGSIYFVKSRNCYAGQVYLEIDGEKVRKRENGNLTKKISIHNALKDFSVIKLSNSRVNKKYATDKNDLKTLAEKTKYIDLSADAFFSDLFIENMIFIQ